MTELYYIKMDGEFTWGINSRGIFKSKGDARKSITNKFKSNWISIQKDCKELGLKSYTEYRKHLEDNNRLEYPIIEL